MTITYANGTMVEAITLVCTDGFMRVAVRGGRDAVEFVAASDGKWLSESGEVVRIGDAAPQPARIESLDEFICPRDVMRRLLGSLCDGAGVPPDDSWPAVDAAVYAPVEPPPGAELRS